MNIVRRDCSGSAAARSKGLLVGMAMLRLLRQRVAHRGAGFATAVHRRAVLAIAPAVLVADMVNVCWFVVVDDKKDGFGDEIYRPGRLTRKSGDRWQRCYY